MNEIDCCSPEIGIYTAEIPICTPETASDWSEIATRSLEIGKYRKETTGNALAASVGRRWTEVNCQEIK